MSKFEKKHRLAKEEQQKLLLELCHALVVVKKLEEAANLLIDLFSKQEIEMIAKRLKIAKLLVKEKTYDQVCGELKVSPQTVARVSGWLDQAGAGYRLIIERDKEMAVPKWKPLKGNWNSLKRKYPLYYWPQILLEEIVRGTNNRQRQKLLSTLKVLKKSGQKYEVFRQIENILQDERKITTKQKL